MSGKFFYREGLFTKLNDIRLCDCCKWAKIWPDRNIFLFIQILWKPLNGNHLQQSCTGDTVFHQSVLRKVSTVASEFENPDVNERFLRPYKATYLMTSVRYVGSLWQTWIVAQTRELFFLNYFYVKVDLLCLSGMVSSGRVLEGRGERFLAFPSSEVF